MSKFQKISSVAGTSLFIIVIAVVAHKLIKKLKKSKRVFRQIYDGEEEMWI